MACSPPRRCLSELLQCPAVWREPPPIRITFHDHGLVHLRLAGQGLKALCHNNGMSVVHLRDRIDGVCRACTSNLPADFQVSPHLATLLRQHRQPDSAAPVLGCDLHKGMHAVVDRRRTCKKQRMQLKHDRSHDSTAEALATHPSGSRLPPMVEGETFRQGSWPCLRGSQATTWCSYESRSGLISQQRRPSASS